jgi:hypothetical protein
LHGRGFACGDGLMRATSGHVRVITSLGADPML